LFIAYSSPGSQTINCFTHEFITKTIASVLVYWILEIRKYQQDENESIHPCKRLIDAALQSVFIICATLHFIIPGKVFLCPQTRQAIDLLSINHKLINQEGRGIILRSSLQRTPMNAKKGILLKS
jgi:hypothetical protein